MAFYYGFLLDETHIKPNIWHLSTFYHIYFYQVWIPGELCILMKHYFLRNISAFVIYLKLLTKKLLSVLLFITLFWHFSASAFLLCPVSVLPFPPIFHHPHWCRCQYVFWVFYHSFALFRTLSLPFAVAHQSRSFFFSFSLVFIPLHFLALTRTQSLFYIRRTQLFLTRICLLCLQYSHLWYSSSLSPIFVLSVYHIGPFPHSLSPVLGSSIPLTHPNAHCVTQIAKTNERAYFDLLIAPFGVNMCCDADINLSQTRYNLITNSILNPKQIAIYMSVCVCHRHWKLITLQ